MFKSNDLKDLKPRKEDLARFWSKVTKSSNCWTWGAGVDKDGYGKFKVNGKNIRAHRFSYSLVKELKIRTTCTSYL